MKEAMSSGGRNGSQLKFSGPRSRLVAAMLLCISFYTIILTFTRRGPNLLSRTSLQAHQVDVLAKCRYIRTSPGPPADFHKRQKSDRFEEGTRSVLLRNAKLWTGERNGTEVVYGDVFLDGGIIKAVGYIPSRLLLNSPDVEVKDVNGAWITPGLVDLHSHLAVYSSPGLLGAFDGNSLAGPILPWLRAIDGLNTHDEAYKLSISGGVTTAQILPGSANNIGGQGIVMKLRSTIERSATSLTVEPPYTLNGTHFDHTLPPRWRHMKHACGENPSGIYSMTRMDSAWNFRHAYDEARKIKEAQDQYCDNAEAGLWNELRGDFPENLQWESLVDVLRGKVKLSVHCYEAVDLDGIVRLSNEFKFPVASFHHAGETYLVPDLLKKTWGGAPAAALFASNFRKKREAYRGSEFAPRILAEHHIPVVMKSDHPVLNSRYLLYEAALAHFYGLSPGLALSSVTTTPAKALGLGHRLGLIREGFDADLVIWDSHPLSLGATPLQVYIDGQTQLQSPYESPKPIVFQEVPATPNFDKEAAETVEYEGLPPLTPKRTNGIVVFTNVKGMWMRNQTGITQAFNVEDETAGLGVVVVDGGNIICSGANESCLVGHDGATMVDLKGGSLLPGLTTFGSDLGLSEILLEDSTNDGVVFDPLTGSVPSIVGGIDAVIRAVDGLQFGTRNALTAYRAGVTKGVVAPVGRGFLLGLSTAFSTAATHALEHSAIEQDAVALHLSIGRGSLGRGSGSASVSTQIATLRRLLTHHTAPLSYGLAHAFSQVSQGEIPLVINVQSADIMATLLQLKEQHDQETGNNLRLVFAGAAEAHLLAKEIGQAGVSVIVTPSRPFPNTWDERRILPGVPLTYDSAITKLLAHNVAVAIGVENAFAARNTRFDIAWAALESNERIGQIQAIDLASSSLDRILGVNPGSGHGDLVAYEGGDIFQLSSKVVGVISPQRSSVDLF